jgi:hypothetical protein
VGLRHERVVPRIDRQGEALGTGRQGRAVQGQTDRRARSSHQGDANSRDAGTEAGEEHLGLGPCSDDACRFIGYGRVVDDGGELVARLHQLAEAGAGVGEGESEGRRRR